jgi:hypothetical protein
MKAGSFWIVQLASSHRQPLGKVLIMPSDPGRKLPDCSKGLPVSKIHTFVWGRSGRTENPSENPNDGSLPITHDRRAPLSPNKTELDFGSAEAPTVS